MGAANEHRRRLSESPKHYDFDHSGNHGAFTKANYLVQRAHHEHAPGNARFALTRPQWGQPIERIQLVDGDTELLPGLELIETSGHVPGHQSVLVRLPKTGAVLLTIDAVPFREGFVRDLADDGNNPDAEATRASTNKLLDLVEQEHIGLVIFGHEPEQWEGLKSCRSITSKDAGPFSPPLGRRQSRVIGHDTGELGHSSNIVPDEPAAHTSLAMSAEGSSAHFGTCQPTKQARSPRGLGKASRYFIE